MKVRLINSAILLFAAVLFSAIPAFAQESEAVVVDEVIAQVNDGVITLSRVKREMKTAADSLVQQGKKPEEAKAEVEKKKGELIANLITEELILQRGKEINLDAEVEAQVNQRFTQIMKEQNIKTINALYEEMRKANVNPDEIREVWRRQFIRDMVLQREVDQRIYFSRSNKEIKDYYERNKTKFTKPESVTLSEIFLSFAGRDEAAIRAKADQLIAALRGGADFTKTVLENSDTPNVAETKGSVGTFAVPDLSDKIAAAIKNVKVGDVGKLETEEGIEIIRVDSRVVASSESVFDESKVRAAMTYAVLPDERRKYVASLRKDAYINISESYRAMVEPHLTTNETKAEVKKAGK